MTPLYQRLITEPTRAALAQLHADQNSLGTAPEDDLDVLAGLVMASKCHHILQFGTFLGGSALVLADLLVQNGPDAAKFVTVDPNPAMNQSCNKYAALAGLGGIITTIDGYSTDPALLARLREPWDMIFLDTIHSYGQTKAEIAVIAPLCGPHTLFTFHDASTFAADTLDLQHQGGVKRAMREWVLTNPKWQMFVAERPAFGQYGIGILQKKVAA